jgi:ABC-type multidrug transport system fused ATPase/permease subunit
MGMFLMDKEKKSRFILWIGAGLLGTTVVFAILVLTGVIVPNIFPPTGNLLDVNPLSSGLLTFLMLIILIYVSTRVLDFGLKYRKEPDQKEEPEMKAKN